MKKFKTVKAWAVVTKRKKFLIAYNTRDYADAGCVWTNEKSVVVEVEIRIPQERTR